MGRSVRVGFLLLLAAAGCSPLYAYRSAAGHMRLLWNKRGVAETIADPATSPGRRERLKLVLDARRFAVEKLALSPSRDFASWTPVDGAVTWLVYACSTTSLKPVTFLGFPYKGHFRKEQAEAEAARWTKKGYDAAVVPASAYNTPLPMADPLPSAVLDYGWGDLAELLFHEFAHGTLGSEESAAQWIGERGAEKYLFERFGETSPSTPSGSSTINGPRPPPCSSTNSRSFSRRATRKDAATARSSSTGRAPRPRRPACACRSRSTTPSSPPAASTAAIRSATTTCSKRAAAPGRASSPLSSGVDLQHRCQTLLLQIRMCNYNAWHLC
ncbi:MAG: aminopeptidase [Elusimicrobiota bacterium]|nr:MAG: aminopeptidase [Elusimicrobiota bacterium]